MDARPGATWGRAGRGLLRAGLALAALSWLAAAPAAAAQDDAGGDDAVQGESAAAVVTADDLMRWLAELDRPETASAARASLADWVGSLVESYSAYDGDPVAIGPEIGTWITVARRAAEDLPTVDAVALLEPVHAVATRLADPDRRAALAHDLARVLLDAGRLSEAGAVLEQDRDVLDGRWVYRPLLEHQRIRLARLSGRFSEGLDLAEALFADGHLYDVTILADDEADPRQVPIGELHRRVRGLVLGERARLELELGRIDRAAAAVAAELDLAEGAEDSVLEVDARMASAATRYLSNDPDGTLDELDRLIQELQVDPTAPTMRFLRGMALGGRALSRAGEDRAEAERELQAALLSGALDQLAGLDAEWMLAELALAADELDTAERWTARGRERFDAWEQPADEIGTRELRLLANEAQLACARDADEATLRSALDGLTRGLEVLLDSWGDVDLESGGVGFLESEERRGLLGELVRVRARLDSTAGLEAAFEDLLQAQAMGSVARREELEPGDLESVRELLLGPDRGLLVWVVTAPTIHALAIDQQGIRHFELPGRDRLQGLADTLDDRLRAGLAEGLGGPVRSERLDALEQASRALAASLVPDELLLHIGRWRATTSIGLEPLRGALLGALSTPAGDPLGELLGLTSVPSIPVALAAARARREASSVPPLDMALLVHLDPSAAVSERFGRLQSVPLDQLDLESSLARYPEDATRVLADPSPSAEDLWTALDEAAVVQVLAHGVLDPFRERGSGVVLSGDGEELGVVWPEDVEALELRPRGVVILTSCGTAVGPRRTGDDEPTSLAAALLSRGARAVVTTRAKLELALAEDLAALLHRALAAGLSTADALRFAKRELGAEDPVRRWELAQVRLLGDAEGPFEGAPRTPPEQRAPLPLIGGAALVLLLVAGAVIARRR